jgi:hypothetical protein
MPPGERAYLSSLICPSGAKPKFSRDGSYGPRTDLPQHLSASQSNRLLEQSMGGPLRPGELDHHVIDGYSVDCDGQVAHLFLDMYHCDKPATRAAPRGFSIDSGGG